MLYGCASVSTLQVDRLQPAVYKPLWIDDYFREFCMVTFKNLWFCIPTRFVSWSIQWRSEGYVQYSRYMYDGRWWKLVLKARAQSDGRWWSGVIKGALLDFCVLLRSFCWALLLAPIHLVDSRDQEHMVSNAIQKRYQVHLIHIVCTADRKILAFFVWSSFLFRPLPDIDIYYYVLTIMNPPLADPLIVPPHWPPLLFPRCGGRCLLSAYYPTFSMKYSVKGPAPATPNPRCLHTSDPKSQVSPASRHYLWLQIRNHLIMRSRCWMRGHVERDGWALIGSRLLWKNQLGQKQS